MDGITAWGKKEEKKHLVFAQSLAFLLSPSLVGFAPIFSCTKGPAAQRQVPVTRAKSCVSCELAGGHTAC